jgi:hypothetical protein
MRTWVARKIAFPPVVSGVPLKGAVDVTEGAPTGGQGHGCAALSNGTVWCWRTTADGNRYGQLGNGTPDTTGGNAIFRATQVLIAANTPLTGVKALARSQGPATCAITNDEKLYCWGALDWVVNNGNTLISPYAQAITVDGATELTGVVQASLGDVVTCAIVKGTTTNEVRCWGYNETSSLGLGDTMNRRYPTKVPGFTNPTVVAVSPANFIGHGDAGCAIDGVNVRCWGYNGDGAVGIGTTTPPYVNSPMVAKLQDGTTPFEGAIDLRAGYSNFCALRTGNAIWCWGNGYSTTYPSNYGATNVVTTTGNFYGTRFLTSDGVYHTETTTKVPNCGALQ